LLGSDFSERASDVNAMTLESFIQAKLSDRLRQHYVVLFHDPEKIYQDIVEALANEHIRVVHAGGDLLEAREQCLEELQRVGKDETGKAALLVYVNYAAALDEREQYEDPLAMVGLAGSVFPHGAGDSFKEMCLQYLPEQSGKIEELFATGELPTFALINGLRSGASDSVVLRQVLNAEGPKDILTKFLCADEETARRLRTSSHWIKDLKDLVQRTLGLRLEGQKGELTELQDALWRHLLFSEFVVDLPVGLPAQLQSVPHAEKSHAPFLKAVCQALRDSVRMQANYEDAATRVARDLGLEELCAGIEDFGLLDTFSFEERGFLHRFAALVAAGDFEAATQCVANRQLSFWVLRDVSRAAEWTLADLLLRLLVNLSAAEIHAKQPLETLIATYQGSFSSIDRLHREAEHVATEIGQLCEPLEKVMALARMDYYEAADKLARSFQSAAATEGWPAQGRQRAVDTFDMVVEPLRKNGQKVAVFWVDALRFDLGAALEGALSGRHKTQLDIACAQLPGVTTIGMAALLSGASSSFEIVVKGDKIVPVIDGREIDGPKARAEALAARVGKDRSRVVDLDTAATGKLGDLDGLEVIAIKTNDIDSMGESNPDYFLKIIPDVLRKIELAVNRLADAGFQHAIISADHGFCWMREASAGHSIAKPSGDWALSKDRCLLGSGNTDERSVRYECRSVGIRTDLPLYVCPAGLATYSAGTTYFHGGLSPQEALIPVLSVALQPAQARATVERVLVNLTYRGGAVGKVTSLIPSLELAYPASDFFGPPSVRLIIQGINNKSDIVASTATSPSIDPTTGEIHLERGKALKIPIRIQEGFEGTFTVKALDPSSGITYATVELTTDYHH
jgi:hypothetical protein